MNLLKALSLNVKLPLIIVGLGLGLAVAGTLQVVNIVEFRLAITDEVEQQFAATSAVQEWAAENWLRSGQAALLGLAASPATQTAIKTMGEAWSEIPDAGAVLQKAYITDNPNPPGQRSNLKKVEGPDGYHLLHASYHDYFSRAVNLEHFYDLLLVDPRGNIVYSYAKEVDFATNLQKGPYAGSNLGQAVAAAVEGRSGIAYFSDFQEYAPSGNAPAAFIATQVLNRDGKSVGVIAAQLDSALLHGLMEGMHSSGEIYLVGADGRTRSAGMHEGDAGILTQQPDLPQVRAAAAGEAAFFADVTLSNGQTGFARSQPLDMGGIPWGLVVERDKADVLGPINRILMQIALFAAGLAAILLVLGYFFARSVTRPIARIGGMMETIAGGDLQVTIADADRQDEIGRIAQSLQALQAKLATAKLAEEAREKMQEDLRLVVESLRGGMNDLASGDLSRPIEEAFATEYEGLRGDFNQTLATLSDTITQVVDSARNIRARSTEISSASEDLSRRTENQAAALEETAAALDELTVSVKTAADSAREVEGIVRQARKEAEESGVVVQGAVAAMAEIEKSSEQISQIIGAIDDIAFQTNLLALNAGVEAARAGDAGKGFAVVASEVRALAHRSSAAAKEIKALISASALHVGRGVDQVGRAGEALHSIVGSVGNVASLVSTIAAGAAEQSTGLGEINIGVTQLDRVTQQNAAMVEESAAASQMLRQDATGLSDLVARFRLTGGPEPDLDGEEAEPVEIALSEFVPSGFASSESLAAEAQGAPRPRPQRVAGGNQAIWQDF